MDETRENTGLEEGAMQSTHFTSSRKGVAMVIVLEPRGALMASCKGLGLWASTPGGIYKQFIVTGERRDFFFSSHSKLPMPLITPPCYCKNLELDTGWQCMLLIPGDGSLGYRPAWSTE